MLNLYIDFDGVIVNSIDITYKMLQDQGIDSKNYSETLKFYESLDWKAVLERCSVINDGWNCIQKILDCHRFNVVILTHVTSIHEAEEKVHYIRKHFKDITIIPVPKSISKTKMIKSEGAVLVDDFVHNLKEWEAAGGYGIRFDLDMDGKGFTVIDRLDVLPDLLD